MQAYDPRVHAGRPDASQQGVARRLMALLEPADWVPARVQDPFALRTVPQVHAPFVDALVDHRAGGASSRSTTPPRTRW